MSNATTRLPKVLPLDWKTRDPQLAMVMGKNLSSRGLVVWRQGAREWKVLEPTLDGMYWTVRLSSFGETETALWIRLTCSCLPVEHQSDPCVHKAAVHWHASQPSEYRYYTEGV